MKKTIEFKNSNSIWIKVLILILVFLTGRESAKNGILQNKIPQSKTENVSTEIITPTINSELISVVRIIDGDTLILDINGKEESVRLIGVDTPEIKDPRKTVKCFGKEASQKAKELMENKKVKLEIDTTQNDRDKYNRLLRYVYLEDGTLVNKKLIKEGFGFEYTYQVPYKFQTEFKEAQKIAETNKIGLWADNACPK